MKCCKLPSRLDADRSWFRKLDEQCFPLDDPFLNGDNYHWWILKVGRRVVGYAGLYIDGRVVHFSRCGILPEYRGKNLQQELIKARLRWCRRMRFKVVLTYTSLDNQASAANLEKCGFCRRRSSGKSYLLFRLVL